MSSDLVISGILGIVFTFIGIAACAIAAIHRRGGVRILVWCGLFVGLFGVRILAEAGTATGVLPESLEAGARYAIVSIRYLLVVFGLLFWLELATGKLRRIIQAAILVSTGIGVTGVAIFFATGSPNTLMPYASIVAVCALILLTTVVLVPRLSRKLLVVQSPVLAFGMICAAAAAIYVNVSVLVGLGFAQFIEPIAFAVFVLSLLYVAAERVFTNERHLLSIQNELNIARGIQNSILPTHLPEVQNLRIAAAYHPMTAVAGDFYHFIETDPHRLGILVADVTGHGVPAALISSMIKVAVESVVTCAHDPAQVLRGLNRILCGQLRGQFVSAAYLWIDTENRRALYSAAGHPPLRWWRSKSGELQRVESNGLLFGIKPDCEYPVYELPVECCDRFVLYTDGMTEPENARGEQFGERHLEEVVRKYSSSSGSELLQQLMAELRKWQAGSAGQQDDITLILADVV